MSHPSITTVFNVVIPLKPFGQAKARLTQALSPVQRYRLGQALATHTLARFRDLGVSPLIVASEGEVADWAKAQHTPCIIQEKPGLNQAITQTLDQHLPYPDKPWLVCHADLPFLRTQELDDAFSWLQQGRSVISPSADGGTTLLGSNRIINFGYGPASFSYHLAQLGADHPHILVSFGLLCDLDTPVDLELLRRKSPYWTSVLDGTEPDTQDK